MGSAVIKMQYGKLFITVDLCKDDVGKGLLNIFFVGDQLGKQWVTPDTMLMKIDKRPGAEQTNGDCPGNEDDSVSFGIITHLTVYR